MSLAMLDVKQADIKQAYKSKNELKVKIETIQFLNYAIVVFINKFRDRINSIVFDEEEFEFNEEYVMSDKHRKDLIQWITRLFYLKHSINDEEFGKIKVDFESWYYNIGGKSIKFEYKESYLLTPKEASDILGVSNVTINKYIKQGMEYMQTRSHRKIPKHAVLLWKDPVYCILMQKNFAESKSRNQSPKERLLEISQELLELQLKYGIDTLEEARTLVECEEMEISEYYEWEALEEEYAELKNKLKGKDSSE